MTKPLLYQHFSSKRALYLELVGLHRGQPARSHRALFLCGPTGRFNRSRWASPHTSAWWSATSSSSVSSTAGTTPTTWSWAGPCAPVVEDAIAEAIDPLIDAGLDPDHRRLLAYGIVGMAEGASRRFMAQRLDPDAAADEEAQRLARRVADLAWAGLRSVHAD